MNSKRKWIWIYLYVIVAAFSFGFAYDMAYEEAWANQQCNCTKTCPGVGDKPAHLYGEWPFTFCDFDPINCYDCILPK